MEIRFKNYKGIVKALHGTFLTTEYDPDKDDPIFDTWGDRLYSPDLTEDKWKTPWTNAGRGNNIDRYATTLNYDREYVRGLEGLDYYKAFTRALYDNNGNLTPLGEWFAKLTNAGIPSTNTSIIDNNNTLHIYLSRNKWNEDSSGVYSHAAYLNTARNDQISGSRHNIAASAAYYITDEKGNKILISPKEKDRLIGQGYTPSSTPTTLTNDARTRIYNYYELLAPKALLTSLLTRTDLDSSKEGGTQEVPAGEGDKEYGFNWKKIGEGFSKLFSNPDIIALGRLAGNLANNEKVYDEALKGINPVLRKSYHTYSQVTGDEGLKRAYYNQAAQGENFRNFISDLDRWLAAKMEARRAGNLLREKGDLADNAEIKRTRDLSLQHQNANTQRDTEIANLNTESLNKADSLRHLLLSQKHSALWTSIDLFLSGIEYRKRQKLAEWQLLEDSIDAIDVLQGLYTNPDIQAAKANYESVRKAHTKDDGITIDYTDGKVEEAKRAYYRAVMEYRKKKLREKLLKTRNPIYVLAKSGTKLTYKKKDDLLYKQSRDTVEHFRKMSKMSSDSYNRKQPKIEKLAPHPKGKTKKYLLGGLAPFTIYKPVAVGGETTATTSSGGTSSTGGEKNKLDLMKELFKSLKGLPSDMNRVFAELDQAINNSSMFGSEMSSDDIASIYLNAMRRATLLSYSKEMHDKAYEHIVSNDAKSEIAVGTRGEIYFLDASTGKIKTGSISDLKDSNLIPLTNEQLLYMRASNPNMVFRDDIFGIVNNGVGLSKISELIKKLAADIGSTEQKLEGISLVESNKIKAGILILAGTQGTPDGYYKVSNDTKTSKLNVQAALSYIYNMLPNNYKTILEIHSNGKGKALIYNFLTSQTDEFVKLDISPLTGKASDKDNSKEVSEGLKLDAATALVTGKGYKTEIELNPGSNYAVKALGRFSEFQKKSGENMGAGTTMLEATESTIKGNLDWNKATIGGSKIIPTAYNQVILNNGEVAGVDLPVDPSNPDTPDFEMLKQLENLDKLLKLNNIEDSELNWKKVNEICDKIGIPHKYDSTGKLNLTLWKRFAAFLVTTPDTALVNKNVILDMVGIASKEERDLYNNFILNKTNNKNFELSDTFLGFGHRDELYKGTVFVPIKENIVASAISSGLNIYMNLATDLELREQGYDPSKVKSYKKSEYSL